MEKSSSPRTPSPVSTQRLYRREFHTQLPRRYNELHRTTTALQWVDPIISCEVTTYSETGQSAFLLGGCYKDSQRHTSEARIRGSNIDTTQPPLTSPDILVEHTFSDFLRLRDAIYEAAAEEHGSCKYCRAMIKFTLVSTFTPHRSIQQLRSTSESQCTALSRFLEDLIQLAVQPKAMPCSSQQRIAELACEFLQLLTQHRPKRAPRPVYSADAEDQS